MIKSFKGMTPRIAASAFVSEAATTPPTPQHLWWTREGYKEYLALMKTYKEEDL